MITTKFYLKPGKANKKGEKPIVMSVAIGHKRPLIFHIGKSVKPNHWSKSNQKVNTKIGKGIQKEINDLIDESSAKAKKIYKDIDEEGLMVTPEIFKARFQSKGRLITTDFDKVFDEFITASRSHKTRNTIKGYITVRNFIKDYEEFSGTQLRLEIINASFFDDFRSYCYNEKGINVNYFAKIINVIKSVMNWALDKEYHSNLSFKKFKAPERPKDIVFLDFEELMHLHNFEFESERLNNVRDLYCFGCYTGLRYGDVQKLKHENIDNDKITLTITKVKEHHSIPLNKWAKEILSRHRESFLPLPNYSNQKTNEYIKEACKVAGIDTPVQVSLQIGGELKSQTLPKYELITFHTSRKTFVTNSLILGMNVQAIKKVTGHKKDEVFNRYLKVSDQYVKNQMNNAWDK